MDANSLSQTNKIPPQSIDAEGAILACIMMDRDAIVKVADILQPEDFYDPKHKLIFAAIVELFSKNSAIDLVTVSNLLEEQGVLDRSGGAAYLAELISVVPSTSHTMHYADIVRKKGTLRKLITTANLIQKIAFEEQGDIEDILDAAEKQLFGVSQKHLHQNFLPIGSILNEAFERIDELHREKGKLRGTATGFVDLDNLLGGLQKSNLVVLAARPSMGKSSLAIDIVRHAAAALKVPVGIFSLEMSKDEVVDRLLSAQSGVNLWKIRTGNMNDGDWVQLGEAMGILSEAPIYIDDTAGATVMEIRTKSRRLQAEHKVGMIVVDYLQLMSGRNSNSDNRVQEVSEISRSLKLLARELNVPVIALSQLSRNVENRDNKVPNLADLRESGSIEQDADVVMFIYREDAYKGAESRRPNIAEVHVKKHRNGPIGKVDLYFDAEKASFRNLEKHADIPPSTHGE